MSDYTSDYTIVGKRMPRVDSRAKVMGKAKFTADLKLPGMLVGKIKRSPYAHARILNIDTSKAKSDILVMKWQVWRLWMKTPLLKPLISLKLHTKNCRAYLIPWKPWYRKLNSSMKIFQII